MRRKAHPHEHQGELNIVPYLDIMVNLVMFMLMSMTGFVSFQMINVNMPDLSAEGPRPDGSPPPDTSKNLTLSVTIAEKGFYLAGQGGILPGETQPSDGKVDTKGTPPTIPVLADGEYDYTKLTTRMEEIKARYPQVTQFFLSADPKTKYDVIVRTMDATRGDPTKPLFPDVAFAAVAE